MFPEVVISTGIASLNQALGTGGIPRGCFVEIAGPVSCGKTSLCLSILAMAQKQNPGSTTECAIIDADLTFDIPYAKRCGVNIERLILCEPANAEQALDTLERLVNAGVLSVIVLDSLTHLVSLKELNAPFGGTPDQHNRQDYIDNLVALTLQRLSQTIRRTQTTILFTRQTGLPQVAIYHQLSQNPTRLALNLHAAIRLELHPTQPIHKKECAIGQRVEIRILRNQFASCRQSIGLDIIYGRGFVHTGS